jgi:hypothetical protein
MYKLSFDDNELYEIESIVEQAFSNPSSADISDWKNFISMKDKMGGYMELTEDEFNELYSVMRQAFKHPSSHDICDWDFFYSAYNTIKETDK